MKFQFGIILFVLSLGAFFSVSGQELPRSRLFLDVPADSFTVSLDSVQKVVYLPHKFIIPSSERLYLKSFKLLKGIHYRIDYRTGQITLLQKFSEKLLNISYRKYPFPLVAEYMHRKLEKPASGSNDDSLAAVARMNRPKFLDDLESYQSNLRKSGSIVRGVEIGSNRDLALNSGLNLRLSGFITPSVELVAALTDASTPIQPEGNTQTLREVDNVFVKIKSPFLGGTLGDFKLARGNSQFGAIHRKLQGIMFTNQIGSATQNLIYGSSRGTFNSMQFLGQEGKQGPYQLTGKNGSRQIIVLAGTERVFIDGEAQIRGENHDYVIDYGLGQITFTNNKLITSENRIEVDFEYSNAFQRYGKNLFGISSRAENIGGRLSYDLRFFREWDDTNNLLEDSAPLTEEEKNSLKSAGDDPFKAAVSSARFVGEGKGSYVKSDTTIGLVQRTYFRYAGIAKGDYLVRFTSVGQGRGDYRRARLGVYEFVGPGNGDFLPIRLVPLAGEKKFTDVRFGLRLSKNWTVGAETAVSQFDKNIFSSQQDGNNTGSAINFSTNFSDSTFQLGKIKLGRLSFNTIYRHRDQNFSTLDRNFRPEYAYKWNLSQAAITNFENSIESRFTYQPIRLIRLQGSLGNNDKGAGISSTRKQGQIFLSETFLPSLNARYENIRSTNPDFQSNWVRQSVTTEKKFAGNRITVLFNREDRTRKESSRKITGFTFNEAEGSIEFKKLLGIKWMSQVKFRKDFLYNPENPGQRLHQATTSTYEFQGLIQSTTKWQGRFSFAIRNKNFTPFFEKLPADSIPKFQPNALFQDTTWRDQRSNLAKVELQYRNRERTFNARWDYKIASELQALREKVYLDVGENRGNFRFDSSLTEYVPDAQGNFLLIVLPTGKFESITRLESAWRIRYRPRTVRKNGKLLPNLWQNISGQTYLKIEEDSREDNVWQLYTLNLSKFNNPKTTLRGAITVNQDVFFFERNPLWGIQLRSRYRNNLNNQFLDANNNDTRVLWERSIEGRRRVMKNKLNITFGYKNELNKREVSSLPSRNRNIIRQVFISGINYRPAYAWQIQAKIERGWERDRAEENPLKVIYWNIRPRILYSIRGRARASLDLNTIYVRIADNPLNRVIPFEMGKGKKEGFSWLWNFRFEYFLSNNVTITANYNGRKDATARRTIHLGKAEIRAFF